MQDQAGRQKLRGKKLVYTVSHKLLAQVTSKIGFVLKAIELQRKHNIFMSGRGTVAVRGGLDCPGYLGGMLCLGGCHVRGSL